ncbi:MAG: hypothetical protein RL214_710 [Pseudomonadota bacterium]|jgi:ankyrin repeat protein
MEDNTKKEIAVKQATQKPIEEKNFQQDPTKKWLYLFKEKKISEQQVLELLEAGADVNVADENGRTALHYAIKSADKTVVERLVENKIDVNVADQEGKTALHYAIMFILTDRFSFSEIAKLLIESKTDINLVDKEGKTALHYAVICMNKAVVESLIKNKAKVNAVDNEGRTALHHAAIHRNIQIVERLIKNGADVNALDNEGKSALYRVVRFNRTETAKLLILTVLLKNLSAAKPDYINSKPFLSEFWDTCCAEIKGMQKENISGSRLSVYEFYVRESSELVKILSKWVLDGVKEKFNQADFLEKFPIFSDRLKVKLAGLITLKKERDNLLGLAKECKIRSKDNCATLNEDTVLRVFEYLSTTEIKNFLKALFYAPVKPAATISDIDFNTNTATLRLE